MPEKRTIFILSVLLHFYAVADIDHGVGHLWALRMMSESSNAPFLRCACAFASHREPHGVADAMIDAVVADLLCQPFNPVS